MVAPRLKNGSGKGRLAHEAWEQFESEFDVGSIGAQCGAHAPVISCLVVDACGISNFMFEVM